MNFKVCLQMLVVVCLCLWFSLLKLRVFVVSVVNIFSLASIVFSVLYFLFNLTLCFIFILFCNFEVDSWFINVLGNVSIQNVLNATRIYINPSMPEAVAFKEGYV
jgi:hypothetical protein